MSEKIDPVESGSASAHSKKGEGSIDIASARTSESNSEILQPATTLIEKGPETIRAINRNYYGFLYALDLLFLAAFVTVLFLVFAKNLDSRYFEFIITWGRWLTGLIVLANLIGFVDKIFNLLSPKPRSVDLSRRSNSSEEKQGNLWQSPLNKKQREFILFYRNFKNLDRLKYVERITIQMLKDGQNNAIRKNNISLYSYKTSGVYQEGSNSDYIEPIHPLTASRIYAMQLVFKEENRNKANKGSLNLNIADSPVPGSNKEMWWFYPWSDVLENIALIASPKSNSRIVAQLLAAYERNEDENKNALQLACKIMASGAKIESYALTELLKIISKDKLYIKKSGDLDKI